MQVISFRSKLDCVKQYGCHIVSVSSQKVLLEGDGKTRLKKQLGLLEGVSIILGIIKGSGIFVSPMGAMHSLGTRQ